MAMSYSLSTFSQTEELLPESKKVKAAYENLLMNPDNKEVQKRYINDFPDNAEVFKQVFHSPTFDNYTWIVICIFSNLLTYRKIFLI